MLISLIEFDPRVDHLLLAIVRQLIGAKGVLVILEEFEFSFIVCHGIMYAINDGTILCGFVLRWIAGSMPGEQLSKSDLAVPRNGCRNLGRDRI